MENAKVLGIDLETFKFKLTLRSLLYLLNNYFDLTADSIDLELVVGHTGEYILSVYSDVNKAKTTDIIAKIHKFCFVEFCLILTCFVEYCLNPLIC